MIFVDDVDAVGAQRVEPIVAGDVRGEPLVERNSTLRFGTDFRETQSRFVSRSRDDPEKWSLSGTSLKGHACRVAVPNCSHARAPAYETLARASP